MVTIRFLIFALVVATSVAQFIPIKPLPTKKAKATSKPKYTPKPTRPTQRTTAGSVSSGSQTPSGTCSYQFVVPDPKGACAGTSKALEKIVDQVKQDLDKTRFMYVSQNSMIQSTIAKIQSDASGYLTKLSDLQTELQKLKQLAANQPSTGNNGNNGNAQNLNQIVHDTKDLLTKAIQDINNKIFNVTYQIQKSAMEESKIQTAIEKQINDQSSKIAQAEQKLQNLENLIKNLQTSSTNSPIATAAATTPGTTPGTNSALVNQLKQQLQKLETEVKQVESSHGQKIKDLTTKADQIKADMVNQTRDIADAQVASQAAFSRLQVTEKEVQDARKNLTQFVASIEPQIKILAQEISETGKNMTRIENSLSTLGTRLLNNQIKSSIDRKDIGNLKQEASKLEQDIRQLNTTISTQAGELAKLSLDITSLHLNATGSAVTSSGQTVAKLVDTVTKKTQSDIQKNTQDLQQLQTVTTTLLKQVSSLAVACG